MVRWRLLAVIFVVGLVARVVAQLVLRAYVQPGFWEYENIANNLLSGRGYTYEAGGITYVAAVSSPFYVVLTAAVYLVTGHSQAAMLILQAVFGATTAALAAWLAARTCSLEAAAWAAGGLVALDPGLAVYSAELHPLSLDALAFLAVVCACVALPDRPTWTRLGLVGGLLGIAALTRTTVLSFVPVLLVWANRFRAVRVVSLPVFALLVVVAVCYGPWPARNSWLLGQFVPGSSESSEWLWRGTNPAATGSSYTRTGQTMLDAAPAAFREQVAAASEAERIGIYQRAALQFIREHPDQAAWLYVEKLKGFWWGSDTTGLLYPPAWLVLYEVWYAPMLLLAGAGMLWGWRQATARPTIILIAAALILVSATQAIFYVEGRHRLAVEPLLLVLSGIGLSQIVGMARLPRWQAAEQVRGANEPVP